MELFNLRITYRISNSKGERLTALETIHRLNEQWHQQSEHINQISIKIKKAKILWEEDEQEEILPLLKEVEYYASYFPTSSISMECHYLGTTLP